MVLIKNCSFLHLIAVQTLKSSGTHASLFLSCENKGDQQAGILGNFIQYILLSANLIFQTQHGSRIACIRLVGWEFSYVECILGKLPAVQAGETGTIVFLIRQRAAQAADLIDAI